MKTNITTRVRYLPSHINEQNRYDVRTFDKYRKSTTGFKLTGKWAIESQFHPEYTSANDKGTVECTTYTMFIQVEITDSYNEKNPDYVDLTWYQSRVGKLIQQPEYIKITYTDQYWIDEDDIETTYQYDPEWVEFDCHVAES